MGEERGRGEGGVGEERGEIGARREGGDGGKGGGERGEREEKKRGD